MSLSQKRKGSFSRVLIVKVKVLPLSRVDSTDILPSNASQIVLHMFRPSPIPLVLILELARSLPKTLNSFS
jgi:hypothetical protein